MASPTMLDLEQATMLPALDTLSLEHPLASMDELIERLSEAAEKSLVAAEAATEAERLAAIAAEEAAEAYLAASAAVGTSRFHDLKCIAEAAEKNTEALNEAATNAYKDYFSACAQSMDASAALENADLPFSVPLPEIDPLGLLQPLPEEDIKSLPPPPPVDLKNKNAGTSKSKVDLKTEQQQHKQQQQSGVNLRAFYQTSAADLNKKKTRNKAPILKINPPTVHELLHKKKPASFRKPTL